MVILVHRAASHSIQADMIAQKKLNAKPPIEYDNSSWTREELTALAWETLMRDHEDDWPEYNDALTPSVGVFHERA